MATTTSNADEALHEALWLALLCQCDRCGAYHAFDEIDYLADLDTWKWAEMAVRRVKPLGWVSPHSTDSNSGELVCPQCAARDASA